MLSKLRTLILKKCWLTNEDFKAILNFRFFNCLEHIDLSENEFDKILDILEVSYN